MLWLTFPDTLKRKTGLEITEVKTAMQDRELWRESFVWLFRRRSKDDDDDERKEFKALDLNLFFNTNSHHLESKLKLKIFDFFALNTWILMSILEYSNRNTWKLKNLLENVLEYTGILSCILSEHPGWPSSLITENVIFHKKKLKLIPRHLISSDIECNIRVLS